MTADRELLQSYCPLLFDHGTADYDAAIGVCTHILELPSAIADHEVAAMVPRQSHGAGTVRIHSIGPGDILTPTRIEYDAATEVKPPVGPEMHALTTSRFSRGTLVVRVTISFFFALNAFAQDPGAPGTVEVERVIVIGSNIPTAEETGPGPVDTYRPADLEKLGIRSPQDFETFLPQEAGSTVNLNIGNGGDGTVQINLRGLLPKETLVLIDGKRVAFGSLGNAGSSQGDPGYN